jgi:putative addiction module killer protein
VYFIRRGEDLIVLLAGGDKDSQARDIAQAIALASEL